MGVQSHAMVGLKSYDHERPEPLQQFYILILAVSIDGEYIGEGEIKQRSDLIKHSARSIAFGLVLFSGRCSLCFLYGRLKNRGQFKAKEIGMRLQYPHISLICV